MRYFEFLDPYYALIQAEFEGEAVQEYTDTVSGDEKDHETLMLEIKEVPEYYAAARLSRGKGENGELMELDEVLDILKSNKKQVLLMDGSLI
ncbi:hypothetical protein NYE67_20615 [Solibacillus sp. FSL W8-0474]|uniref:hypothetical protein n=1 Tax=Solibacillus sp. FSL W8-0474 TaxID=2975336 RepID=UPI0030F8288D